MAFNLVSVIRLAALSVITFFSIIVLGTSAHIISVTESTIKTYWSFIAFAIAVSVLTIITLPLLIAVSVLRSGAPPNFVVAELGWCCILWVLWMASGAYSANQLSILPSGCSFNIYFYSSFDDIKKINCGEFWAVESFAWLNWLVLMPYIGFILVLSIIQHARGNHHVWTRPVHQVDFFAPGVAPGIVPQQPVYAPQPMVQQQPVQYAGAPPVTYATPPPQQQTPMNTGYAQAPTNTGYPPAPTNTGYLPDPANTGYAQGPGYTQDPANAGYAPPAPANAGYLQGPTNPIFPQV